MPRKRKIKPTACVVCHHLTIYENATENHPYGEKWEGRCMECGSIQSEFEWVKDLYALPRNTVVSVRCDRWHAAEKGRCTQMHTMTLKDLLILNVGVSGNGPSGYLYPYASFQCGCPKCGHFVSGTELYRRNLDVLKPLVEKHD